MPINFPNSPVNNQIFTDTTNNQQYLYNNVYQTWSKTFTPGQFVSISDTPPVTTSAGNMWYNSATGETYIYYNDGDSSQWVSVTTTLSGYTGSTGYVGSLGPKGDIGFTGSTGATIGKAIAMTVVFGG